MSIARRHALTGWTKLAHLGIGGTEIVGCVSADKQRRQRGKQEGRRSEIGRREEKGRKGRRSETGRREEAERRGRRETERDTEEEEEEEE